MFVVRFEKERKDFGCEVCVKALVEEHIYISFSKDGKKNNKLFTQPGVHHQGMSALQNQEDNPHRSTPCHSQKNTQASINTVPQCCHQPIISHFNT